MGDAEAKIPLGAAEIAKRPVTYATLALLAAGFVWFILFLNGTVVQQVVGLRDDLKDIRTSLASTREEMVGIRNSVDTLAKTNDARFQILQNELEKSNRKQDEILSHLRKGVP